MSPVWSAPQLILLLSSTFTQVIHKGRVLVLRWDCLAREKGDNKHWDVALSGVTVSCKGGSCQSMHGRGGSGVTTLLVSSRDPDQQGNGGRSEPPALCLQGLKQPAELQWRKRPGLQGVQEKCLCAEGD